MPIISVAMMSTLSFSFPFFLSFSFPGRSIFVPATPPYFFIVVIVIVVATVVAFFHRPTHTIAHNPIKEGFLLAGISRLL
jgi:hypothetical protein